MKTLQSLTAFLVFFTFVRTGMAADLLPSWSEGEVKKGITAFVEGSSTEGGTSFIPPEDRIAVFDNDGTLMVERPDYFHLAFLRDVAASQDVSPWRRLEIFLSGIFLGEFRKLLMYQAGLLQEEYEKKVGEWLRTAEHPRYRRPYRQCVYQPMLELLDLLRSRGFRVYLCSGSEAIFLRGFAQEVYGIPVEQVLGSELERRFVTQGRGGLVYIRSFMRNTNLGDEKAFNILTRIGRKPVFAAGNADGDFRMLELAGSGSHTPFVLLINHDDAEREYSYSDGAENVSRRAHEDGWNVVSMKNDWLSMLGHE